MYQRLIYWKEYYARDDYPDQRSVADFVTTETKEIINSFRSEIYSIAQGNYNEENLQILLGDKRIQKYGSFDAWAQLMLQWIANANK